MRASITMRLNSKSVQQCFPWPRVITIDSHRMGDFMPPTFPHVWGISCFPSETSLFSPRNWGKREVLSHIAFGGMKDAGNPQIFLRGGKLAWGRPYESYVSWLLVRDSTVVLTGSTVGLHKYVFRGLCAVGAFRLQTSGPVHAASETVWTKTCTTTTTYRKVPLLELKNFLHIYIYNLAFEDNLLLNESGGHRGIVFPAVNDTPGTSGLRPFPLRGQVCQ